MIFRRYGESYHSVDTNFDSKALNEVSFRRNREASFPVEELESRYAHVSTHELSAEAEGDVQDETEQALLAQLEERLEDLARALEPGGILLIENEQGPDHPKTRQKISNVVVEGENRLRFHYGLEPALRVGVYRARS